MEDALDTDVFRIVSSSALESILDNIIGPKTLVLQPSLGGPLGLITQVAQLKNHGVQRMFWLDKGPLSNAERHVVYLCRPELKWMRIIADQVKAQSQGGHQHHLIAVPRMTAPCTALLTQLGVLGSIELHEFQMGFIPVDPDVLSLESDDVHRRMSLDGDLSDVYDMAKALMTLQRAFGIVPRFVGKGAGAERLFQLMKRFRKEMTSDEEPLMNGSIDSIIVIDRQVDMVTPFCTQLTYEGLLDEIIGIRNAHVEVEPSLVEPQSAPPASAPSSSNTVTPKKRKHRLASSDRLFEALRDQNFAAVGPILNRHAKRLNEEYERRHEAHEASQLRAFVGQLGTLQEEHAALRLHTALAAEIMRTTEKEEFNIALEVQQNLITGIDVSQQETLLRDLINREAPLVSVLRLLCLYSLVSNGLKQKTIEDLKKEILQTYGHSHLSLLTHLSTLSLVTKQGSGKSPFAQSRKPLRLVVPDDDDKSPTDIAHVFSGYAPLSVRLVQCALGNQRHSIAGWKGIEDVVRSLPGPTIDASLTSTSTTAESNGGGIAARNGGKGSATTAMPTTVVCFLGGVTYAEIAALRFLNRQMTHRNVVIATTNVVSAKTLLTSLMPAPTRPSSSS